MGLTRKLDSNLVEVIFNKMDQGIIITDLKGRIKYANSMILSVFKESFDTIKGTAICNYILFEFHLESLYNTWNGEGFIQTANDGVVCGAIKLDLINNEGEECCLVSVDLSSKHLEDENRGIIVTDSQGTIQRVNKKFERITGYFKNEVLGKNPSILGSGRHKLNYYKSMWAEIHDKGHWSGEIWNKRKTDEIYLEQLIIRAIRDKTNKVTHYIGIFSDITNKRKEESTLHLYSRVFESTSEGVMITDSSGEILLVNPAFTKITGYELNEVIGKNPKMLHSGRHDFHFYKSMWNSIHNKGHWHGEVWNKKRTGELYPEWLTINAVKDESDHVINYVGVFTDITSKKESEEQLRHLAHFDMLTGVSNRFGFHKALKKTQDESKLLNKKFALLFLDLDGLKLINDSLGHSTGDELLINTASRLKNELSEQDIIARLGGDEFGIILREIKDLKHVQTIVERLNKIIATPINCRSQELVSTCSIGISLFPYDGEDGEILLKKADAAMYNAKMNKSGYQFFSDYMLVH